MPKIASIFFLLVFFLPVSSLYLTLKVKQQHVRQEMREHIEAGIEEDQLVLLKIPRALEENPGTQFKRMHAREFRYKGNMYDVVRQETRGDTTWYWCVWDEEETEIVAQLDRLASETADKAKTPKAGHELFKHLLKTPFVGTGFTRIYVATLPVEKPHSFPHSHTLTRAQTPLTPPPEVF